MGRQRVIAELHGCVLQEAGHEKREWRTSVHIFIVSICSCVMINSQNHIFFVKTSRPGNLGLSVTQTFITVHFMVYNSIVFHFDFLTLSLAL